MTITQSFNLDKTYFQDLTNSKDEIFPIAHILYNGSTDNIKKDFSRLVHQHCNSHLSPTFTHLNITIFGEQPFQEDPFWYNNIVKPIIEFIDQGKLDTWLTTNKIQPESIGLNPKIEY